MEKDHTKRRRVGLVFDERMCKHKQVGGKHPENPDRIRAIWDNLKDSAILHRCVVLNAKEAEDDQLALVHTKEHIDLIKTISSKTCKKMRLTANKYNSIYFSKGSSEAAYLAAGFVIEATEQVVKGKLDSAFAIVRPPGHHAEASEPMGFCLLNNVAIATSVILNQRPALGIKKILIVDWDVHHGNSTQKMFYKDPRVLVFSVHRHDSGSFYPEGNDGSYNMMGERLGAGYNINVPWESGGVGDADYIAVWDHILLPVARKFDPDLVIISAGFDAAAGDPIGGCCVSPHGYSIMLYKLMGFARGKIVMALEGGYNLISLANATRACIEMLLDYKPPITSLGVLPLKPTWPLIKTVRQALCVYWPILAAKIPDKVINSRLHEVDFEIRHNEVYAQTPTELEHAQVSVREDYFEGMDRNRRMDKTKEVMGLKRKEAERMRKHGSPSKRVVKQRVMHKKGKMVVTPSDSSSETDTQYSSVNETSELRRILGSALHSGTFSRGKKIVKKGAFDDLPDTSTSDCSEDDMQPRNRFGGVPIRKTTTYYRSNLKAAVKDLKSLRFRDEHINEIKKTPFWMFFNSIYTSDHKKLNRQCNKYEVDIQCVMKTYDMRSNCFSIAGALLEVTRSDVLLILGVWGGSKTVPLKKKEYEIPPWVKRCFETSEAERDTAGTYQLYKVDLLNRLKTVIETERVESYEDVARLVHCYLLAAFLAPAQNGSLNWHITSCCEDLEDIYNYDWCGFIVEMLMDQINRSYNLKAGGCTMLLLYWLCEHTRLIEPCQYKCVPRFLRWDLSELNEKLGTRDISKMKAKYLHKEILNPYSIEKDTYRSLKLKWDNEYNQKKQKIERQLTKIEIEMKELRESLRSSNNKIEALERRWTEMLSNKIEEALKNERMLRDAAYESLYKTMGDAIEKLRLENENLRAKLNA